MTIRLTAPIVSVTVYPGQARVTRRGTIQVPGGGPAEVALGDLPLSLVHESLRVTGRGASTVTGVDVSTVRRARRDSGRVSELLAERDRLALASQEAKDRQRANALRVGLLESVVARAGRPFADQLAGGLAADEIETLGTRLSDQLNEVLAVERRLAQEQRGIAEELDRVQRLLDSGDPDSADPDATQARVFLDDGPGGDLTLEISYLVEGPRWEPRYDLRLSGSEVDVAWFGMVTQASGEDWPECELRLSTARPSAALKIPELEPWALNGLPQTARSARYDLSDSHLEAGEFMAARAPKAAALEMLPAVPEETMTATTYATQRPVAVPSDGSSHQALVANLRLPVELDYVTAPVRDGDVYLRAKVTNASEHALIPGRASLFHETEFVGVTDLACLASGEETELALGLDDRICVKRTLVARKVDKSLVGGATRHEAKWRTTVANHTGRPVRVTVLDQAPLPLSPTIVVKEVATTPKAQANDMGELSWVLDLADGEQAQLELTVKVELARGTSMIGWRE